MIGRLTEKDVKCNSKQKLYPDGSSVITVCSTPLFTRAGYEDLTKCSKEDAVEIMRQHEAFEPLDNPNYCGFPRAPITDETARRHIDNRARDRPDTETKANTDPRDDNVKRAIDSIFDIALCNDWDYFITGTFNDKVVDGSDPKAIVKPVQKWLNHSVSRKGLKYLLVPELHPTSGRIHFHGLINDSLKMSDSGRVMFKGHAVKRSTLDREGIDYGNRRTVYNIDDWRFGFSTAIATDYSRIRLARYVTKYITKDCRKIFGRFYWHSRNITTKPQIIYNDLDYSEYDVTEYCPPRTFNRFKYISDFKE